VSVSSGGARYERGSQADDGRGDGRGGGVLLVATASALACLLDQRFLVQRFDRIGVRGGRRSLRGGDGHSRSIGQLVLR
jgi:hypothetical protein